MVLLGQDLGGCHECTLMAALHPDEQRVYRHKSFARANIALQQSMHWSNAREILIDLAHRALLRAGEWERQRTNEPIDESAQCFVRNAARCLLCLRDMISLGVM